MGELDNLLRGIRKAQADVPEERRDVSDSDVAELQVHLWRLAATTAVDHEEVEASAGLAAMFSRLDEWHIEHGTRDRRRVAHRQTVVAAMLRDGYSQAEIAERVGVGPRCVERDVALLRRIYGIEGHARRPGARKKRGGGGG